MIWLLGYWHVESSARQAGLFQPNFLLLSKHLCSSQYIKASTVNKDIYLIVQLYIHPCEPTNKIRLISNLLFLVYHVKYISFLAI